MIPQSRKTILLTPHKVRSNSLLNFLFQAMSEKVPAVPKHLGARREWRDDCLIGLAKLKKQMKSN